MTSIAYHLEWIKVFKYCFNQFLDASQNTGGITKAQLLQVLLSDDGLDCPDGNCSGMGPNSYDCPDGSCSRGGRGGYGDGGFDDDAGY